MPTSHQRRPEGPTAERQAEALARAQAEKAQADLAKEARRAQEKAEDGQDVSQEAAAQLQRGLGNAAVAAMLKKGSDTDTATSNAEATQDEKHEEEREEGEDVEAEIERALPSFSTGGGGGGGGGGAAPWAVGHLFGGDDDADDELLELFQPRWRPLSSGADPDEDADIEEVEPGAGDADDGEPFPWDDAEAAIGSAPWAPDVLSRGLRHAHRLARRSFTAESLAHDPIGIWARGRALLRWLGAHADAPAARALALAAAATGVPEQLGLSGAITLQLAQAEAALALVRPRQAVVADVALDRHTRAIVERCATAMLERGGLSGPRLLAELFETLPEPAPPPGPDAVHPGALDAVTTAAWLAPIPVIDPWRALPPRVDEDPIDRILRAFTGAPEEDADPPIGARDVRVLFHAMEALLTAIGGVQVELAGVAATIWPHVDTAATLGLVAEMDRSLRATARKALGIGQELEAKLGTQERGAVHRLSVQAVAVRDAVDAARNQALHTLARILDPEDVAPDPDAIPGLEEQLRSKWVEAARARVPTDPVQAVHAASAGVRLDGASAWADHVRALAGAPGLPPPLRTGLRLQALAGSLLAADLGAAARDAVHLQAAGGPYAQALAAILLAEARDDQGELRVASCATHGGALNLLKARWVERSVARAG